MTITKSHVTRYEHHPSVSTRVRGLCTAPKGIGGLEQDTAEVCLRASSKPMCVDMHPSYSRSRDQNYVQTSPGHSRNKNQGFARGCCAPHVDASLPDTFFLCESYGPCCYSKPCLTTTLTHRSPLPIPGSRRGRRVTRERAPGGRMTKIGS